MYLILFYYSSCMVRFQIIEILFLNSKPQIKKKKRENNIQHLKFLVIMTDIQKVKSHL